MASSRVLAQPTRTIALGFLLTILVGGLLLATPWASADGSWTSLVDAVFTATSAVCVTGLTVVDTVQFYSFFGQIVILVLIQLGGLGIMLVASLISLSILGRLSFKSRVLAQTETRAIQGYDVAHTVRSIVKTTFVIEGMVFILLSLRFLVGYGYEPARALWHGLFHSVSAFNNAGFALYSTNLSAFVSDPWICLPISAAIILGGLGFPVLWQLKKYWKHSLKWSMNTKLVLVGTLILLVGGTLYITALEWNNPGTLGPLAPPEKILAGFFQSVQTRTAGFNSIDISQLHPATWLGMDVLMFIGAGPAGTAGGIKITTVAVLFFIVFTELRGEGAVNIFGKRLSRSIHRQALTLAFLGIAAVFTGTLVLLITTGHSLDRCLFEAASAFGTVGLSTGITPDLPDIGKITLVLLMYLGRVGVLSLGTALALKDRKALYELPKERPAIG